MTRKSRLNKEVIKGPWSAQEDELLSNYITLHGEGKWRDLPHKAGLNRCGKSCRLRWLNYLKPGVKRGKISADEEDLIIRMHKLIGNRWSLIAGRLPGRTDNEIKNYWNTNLSKRIHGNKISRGQKRKLQHNQNQETTDKSTDNVCNTLGSETLSSPLLVQGAHDAFVHAHGVLHSADLQVISNNVDENMLVARRNDLNASTDKKLKEVVEESDDNNYVMNAGNGANVADQMSVAYMDFPISTPVEVAAKSTMVDTWDWSILTNPWLLHDEWDLHSVDTFLGSEHNWIFREF